MKEFLTEELVRNGWTEINKNWEYQKGTWKIFRDTSSWLQVSTESNTVVFDISEPEEYQANWTLKLIEQLCKLDDERVRFRKVLESINDTKVLDSAHNLASEALKECFHTWLVKEDVLYCPICEKKKTNANNM